MTARTEPVPWGAAHVFFVAAVFVVTLFLASLPLLAEAGEALGPETLIASLPAFLAVSLAAIGVAARYRGPGLRALGIRTDGLPRALARGLGLYFAFIVLWGAFVFFVYTPLLERLEVHLEQEALQLVIDSWKNDPVLNRVLVLLTVVVAGPLAEELFFRGLLQPLLTARLPVSAGIGVTAILFGLLHTPIPYMVVPIGLLGAFFGWVRVRTGSVLVPVALHMFHNGITLAVFLGNPRLYENMYQSGR
jgi:membrane protease YdiL (CAAX protease family)